MQRTKNTAMDDGRTSTSAAHQWYPCVEPVQSLRHRHDSQAPQLWPVRTPALHHTASSAERLACPCSPLAPPNPQTKKYRVCGWGTVWMGWGTCSVRPGSARLTQCWCDGALRSDLRARRAQVITTGVRLAHEGPHTPTPSFPASLCTPNTCLLHPLLSFCRHRAAGLSITTGRQALVTATGQRAFRVKRERKKNALCSSPIGECCLRHPGIEPGVCNRLSGVTPSRLPNWTVEGFATRSHWQYGYAVHTIAGHAFHCHYLYPYGPSLVVSQTHVGDNWWHFMRIVQGLMGETCMSSRPRAQ